MSLSQQTQHRLPTIKHGLLSGLTTNQIGDKLGVTEKTIDRDIHAWVNSGEFESWLKEEWIRLHTIVLHEDPVEAYRNITKLVTKMLTQHMEASTTHTERLITVQLSAKVLSNQTCLNNQESPSPTNPTINKQNSTKPATNTATEQPSQE